MTRNAVVAATLLAFAAVAQAQVPKKDNPACKQPNPVFGKFPNSFTMTCDQSRFSRLEVFQAKDSAKLDGDYASVPKEGEYWYFIDQIVPDAQKRYPSRLEVFRNFESALKQAGGTALWHDGDRAIHYRLTRPSGEYWGIAGCAGGSREQCDGVLHKIVRLAPMEQAVVVSADQIRKSLAESGKVVFYGIYFDTDKAVIKPESAPTLTEMAKFLKANAGTNVFIVGHTDGQGALDRNQKLARDRAAAVAAALAATHGIPRERMAPDGVGPLAPVAANDNEQGRAKNRRVEMVLR
jgi:outer membrane protein OmpA-like peptidoglycan-associated protein